MRSGRNRGIRDMKIKTNSVIKNNLDCGCGVEFYVASDSECLYQMPLKVVSPCKRHKERPLEEQGFRIGRGKMECYDTERES